MIMKKYFLSMMVMAIFAIGFAASGDDDDEVWVTESGKKYHKKHYTCAQCGDSPEYAYKWVSEDGKTTIDENKLSGNFYAGNFYCSNCISKAAAERDKRIGW